LADLTESHVTHLVVASTHAAQRRGNLSLLEREEGL
jgi:hypothetical protein